MTQQIIDVGAAANDGTGEPLRSAFEAVNSNFTEIYTAGPVGSNVQIANNTITTTVTNTNLVLKPNGIGVIQANAAVLPSIDNVYNIGSPALRFDTVYAGYFVGNGSQLTGVTATGVGTLASLSVTGNTVSGNLESAGVVTATGNVTGGNLITGGFVTAVGNINGANIGTAGRITATGNITGGNILTSGQFTSSGAVNAVGNITGGNLRTGGIVSATGAVTASGNIIAGSGAYFLGDGGLLSNVSAAISVSKIENGTSNVSVSSSGGNITFAIGATANVVVVSTTGVVATGITVPSITKSGSNAVGNIGSSSNYFNQVFATATTALYADVAERFAADEVLAPGTVVELGGTQEITRAQTDLSENVFGVISTRPAYTMNGGAGDDDTHPKVAMTGRVPVLVTGVVKKGDRLVSAGNGIARAAGLGEATAFNTIGRSLVDKPTLELGTIEAIVTIK